MNGIAYRWAARLVGGSLPAALLYLVLFMPSLLAQPASASGEAIPHELAQKAAVYHAQERSPGSSLLSSVPYYALDGSVNAWAFQFVHKDFDLTSEVALQAEVARRSAAVIAPRDRLMAVEASVARGVEDDADPRDINDSPHLEPVPGEPGSRRVTFPSDVAEAARIAQEELAGEHTREQHERQQAAQEYLLSLQASVMGQEMFTIVISARDDLYPFLEAHAGVAAHLRFTEKVAEAVGVQVTRAASESLVERVYYPGQMTYWLEPPSALLKSANRAPGSWVNAEDGLWVDVASRRSQLGRGTLRAPGDKGIDVSPMEVWESFEQTGSPDAAFEKKGLRVAVQEKTLSGVPFYFQSEYGKNSCGPTTFGTILGYWDAKGYGPFVDNGTAMHSYDEGDEDHLVWYCMRDTGYSPTWGTWPIWDPVPSGVRKVAEDAKYANFVDVHVEERDGVEFTGHIIYDVDRDRPVAYCWYIDNADPTTGHWSTIKGYRVSGDNRIVKLNNNWQSSWPDGIEVNTSNVYNSNEWILRIRMQADPFDCLWSDGFNKYETSPVWRQVHSINGTPQIYTGWIWNMLRSHSRPYKPYPQWSAHSYSRKIAPPTMFGATNPENHIGDPYAPNTDAVMYYGPFSTIGRTGGEISAMFALEIDDFQDDAAWLVASVDGFTWRGSVFRDPWAGVDMLEGNWFRARLDLTNVPDLGNLMNREKVYVGVYFHSDGDANSRRGPFVDNININLWPYMPTPLSVPTGMQASQGTHTGKVSLQCSPVAGATHYRFWRQQPGSGAEPITGWIETPSHDDFSGSLGVSYVYAVQSASSPSGTRASSLSGGAPGWRGWRAPYNVTTTKGNHTDMIRLVWWDADGDFFQIERSDVSENGPWNVVKNNVHQSQFQVEPDNPHLFAWSDTGVVAGKDYYYRVRCRPAGISNVWSGWSLVQMGYLKLPVVTGVTTTSLETGIRISWPSVSGRYYSVYELSESLAQPVLIRSLATGSSFTDTNFTTQPGRKHYYLVRQAFNAESKGLSDYGSYVEGYRLCTRPTAVSASQGVYTDRVLVEWAPVDGALYFTVEASSSVNGPWLTLLPWFPAYSYPDYSLTSANTRYYRVRSARTASGYAASSFSDPVAGWLRLGTVQNVQATDGTFSTGVRVTWSALPNAVAYSVWRSESVSAQGTMISSIWTAQLEYLDTTAEPGRLYYYRVQGAANTSGFRAGPVSSSDSGWRNAVPPAEVRAGDGTWAQGIQVRWDPAPGASFYRVFRSETQNGPLVMQTGWIGTTSYNDPTPESCRHYWYAVQAATSFSTLTPSAYSPRDSGWRRLSPPGSIEASDGEYNAINVTWSAVAEADYYNVFYSEAKLGPYTQTGGDIVGTAHSFQPPTPEQVYYVFVESIQSPGNEPLYRSDIGDFDTGWYHTNPPTPTPTATPAPWKWTQAPNMSDGWPMEAYTDTTPDPAWALIADDWLCEDGRTIYGVKWWGGYPGFETGNPAVIPPPAITPSHFILSWYTRTADAPYFPMTLLAQEQVSDFSETSIGVSLAHYGPTTYQYEHVYEYECTLATPWDQTQGEMYFLQIQAVFDTDVRDYNWGWFNAEKTTLAAAAQYWGQADGWTELMWEAHHRLGFGPMGLAFELDTTAPPPTPTPTPTPTPRPTPVMPEGGKWTQPANLADGILNLSYLEAATGGANIAASDDWICPDGLPIRRIKWWGAYSDYETGKSELLPPPEKRPMYFLLSWYSRSDKDPYGPDALLYQEDASEVKESAVGTATSLIGPQQTEYQHVFEYDYWLKTPWPQEKDKAYRLVIQAVYDSTEPRDHDWGWFASDTMFEAPALQRWHPDEDWYELAWPDYHPLGIDPMDLAFELYTVEPTPTPSPTATPTATPTDTPGPTPTPTASPTPTPTFDRWGAGPNTDDGFSRPSWRRSGERTLDDNGTLVADEWSAADDRPLNRVRWWGAYSSWNSDDTTPLAPPPNAPASFELVWSQYNAGPPEQPGDMVQTSVVTATETWHAAVQRWDSPTKYLHIYQHEATLSEAWNPSPGITAFLSIRAVYDSDPGAVAWGWMAAEDMSDFAAVESVEGGPWTELEWPVGHRLEGLPMSMSFVVTAVEELPTPTPSPTPSPTFESTPTPSPTPFGWLGEQAPNLTDGIDILAWTNEDELFSIEVVDDWEPTTDTSVQTVLFWGSYPGWRSDTNAPVDSPASLAGLIDGVDRPAERPLAYTVRVYEYPESGPAIPGQLLHEHFIGGWLEEWAGAAEVWNAPGTWEHEYMYTMRLPYPLDFELGRRYFVGLQAYYTTETLAQTWGWLGSEQQQGEAALRRETGGTWQPLAWPTGHRLAGPMDMAFEMRDGFVPFPTPTPTPEPTPSPTPSPTPPGWYTLQAQADFGHIGLNPSQEGYEPGTTVELNAKGDNGYHFIEWSGDVPAGGAQSNPMSLLMDGNKSVTAHFAINLYDVTTAIAHGTVSRLPNDGPYPHGTVLTLEAHIAPGYSFAGWLVDDEGAPEYLTEAMLEGNPLEFTVIEDLGLTVQTTSPIDAWYIY